MTYIPMIDTSTGEIDAGLVAERNWEASLRSQELKNIRKRLGMDRLPFARMIGYTGTDRNDVMRVKQYEEKKQVPLYIARLVWLIVEYKRADGQEIRGRAHRGKWHATTCSSATACRGKGSTSHTGAAASQRAR